MKRAVFVALVMFCFVLTMRSAVAVPGAVFADTCYTASWSANGDVTRDLMIENTCEGNKVQWMEDVNLTILGDVVDGEVEIGDTWIYVDSALRPDLDASAVLTFMYPPFAVEPDVLRDGTICSLCNITYENGRIEVEVPGFSNYSLQYKQDFTVYSDHQPELKEKVYQTIDLGDARRSTQYACVVQIFGRNENDEWVLVQTNPERKVQARILGNPDANQPESLGYFPTINGIANTYFRNENLHGYMNFELVIQCMSNSSSKLVYEEPIMTRYSPAGRAAVSRGVWLTDGNNAFYVVIYVLGGVIALWLIIAFIRSL